MSLLPADASLHELVQDCFLAYKGAGLMLSPLDVELIDAWSERHVPIEVISRGIRRAAEAALFDARPGEPPLRSLRACKREVDAEIKKYLGRAAGRTEDAPVDAPPPELRRHKKLVAALRKIGREVPALGKGVEKLLAGLLANAPGDFSEAARREEAVDLVLLRSLPLAERVPLLREARELAQVAPSLSARARKLSRRFHRSAVLRRRLSLPSYG